MAERQAHARQCGEGGKVAGTPLPQLAAGASQPATAQAAGQFAGVDADRADGGAQAATGAGVEALIGEAALKIGNPLSGGGSPRQFAPADDALAGRKSQAVRGADDLAKTAFGAAIHPRVGGGNQFQRLKMRLRIVAQNDAGLSRCSGSSSFLIECIRLVASFPHSFLTKGAILRPVPCSPLSAPSYLSMTRVQTSSSMRA